ncbi:MAG: hypothetical protein NTW82_10695 [Bacteroidia bacterium]|nr:hypothetical protein [Bacteroidia bacterium]
MTGSTFQFDFKDLKLAVSQVESVMGYKEGESQETISELVSEVLKEAEEICTMKAEYRFFDDIAFDEAEKTVTINGLVFQIKKIIYSQIKKSDSAALFLCTAGEEIGARSKKSMKEGDLLRGYIYDVVGSEAVEAAADLMQDQLEREINALGKGITNRFSPGYCGWLVAEQHKLFQLLTDNFCEIKLSSSALMYPMKSISGIIGIGKNVKRHPYTCSLCDMKDCIYRRSKA